MQHKSLLFKFFFFRTVAYAAQNNWGFTKAGLSDYMLKFNMLHIIFKINTKIILKIYKNAYV